MNRVVISVIWVLIMIGCGGGGGGNGGDGTNPIDPTDPFEVDALSKVLADTQVTCSAVDCPSADSISLVNQPGGELWRCTWNCVAGEHEGVTRLFLIITDYLRQTPQACFKESFFGLVERETDCMPTL